MKINRVIAGIAVLISASVGTVIPAAQDVKEPCRVEVGLPHISKYFLKFRNINAVKVNAFSICNKAHSNVALTVELWKEGSLFKERISTTIVQHQGMIQPRVKFWNTSTFTLCSSSIKTLYFGKAYAKARIDGKWHYAVHKLKFSTPVKCGT